MSTPKSPGIWGQYKAAPKFVKYGIPIVIVIVIAAAAGGGSSNTTTTSTPSTSAPAPSATPKTAAKPAGNPNRPNEATQGYTPSVGPAHPVTVDGIVYKIEGATTTKTIGDPSGFGSTANGIYVIVRLRVHSDKSASAQFTNNINLVAKGRSYQPDDTATISLTSINNQPQISSLTNLGSHETITGEMVFDVAPDTLSLHPQLKLTELGFGDTKAYIDLPPLPA